ncbi:general stress protein [Metaplanococcus flavidus]|uniref:General stress protein n=1 Tax=Metaplanococcus flavidus TaxID=569883 RepID=A0ABW3L9L7_9BACL
MGTEKKVMAVVFSGDDLMRKMDVLKNQGYSESDIHLVADNNKRLDTIENRTGVESERVNSFKDKFKSFVSGESSVREGIKSLGLTDQETERYTAQIARGGVLLYIEEDHSKVL